MPHVVEDRLSKQWLGVARRRMVRNILVPGALLIALAPLSIAQTATAVPKLELSALTGVWYEIASVPTKFDKHCVGDVTVMFALGDKPRSFQMGTFCKVKGGNFDESDDTGKTDKDGSGKLKLSYFVLLSKKYWVLAQGANNSWALIGTPNHKKLVILSRTPTLPAQTYTEIQSQAAAQGFKTDRIAKLPQGN